MVHLLTYNIKTGPGKQFILIFLDLHRRDAAMPESLVISHFRSSRGFCWREGERVGAIFRAILGDLLLVFQLLLPESFLTEVIMASMTWRGSRNGSSGGECLAWSCTYSSSVRDSVTNVIPAR